MPYNISIKFHPIPSTLNFSRIFAETAAILKFLSLKIMHSKPAMNINSQHHNLHGNQISPKSEDFCIWRPFYTLITMATAAILNFFNPPKAATYYGGFSYKVDHNMAPKPWISIPNIKIYLETKSGGFLYFGGHFGFKMAAIANQ